MLDMLAAVAPEVTHFLSFEKHDVVGASGRGPLPDKICVFPYGQHFPKQLRTQGIMDARYERERMCCK